MPTSADRGFFNRRAGALLRGLPLLFLLLISLPLADQIFHFGPELHIKEKRRLARKPVFQPTQPWRYLEGYQAYFNDHFGFRNHLVFWNNLLTVKLFSTSPIPGVIVGRGGWLFMARENRTRNELDYFRSLRLFKPAELERWLRVLRRRRAWLESRGMAYIFMVVPNKSTIYPEYMPKNIRRMSDTSRLDQLQAALLRDPTFPVVDLKGPFLAAKHGAPLYYKTDSHWNELGAYVAFEKIMEKLAVSFPGLKKPSLDEFAILPRERFSGDLAAMLSLQKGYFREEAIQLRAKSSADCRIVEQKKFLSPYIYKTVSESPQAPLPSLVIVHDSFVHQLQPFLCPNFRRITYIWDWDLHFFIAELEKEKPRILIEEMTERALMDLVLGNPAELNPAPARTAPARPRPGINRP